MKHYNNLNTQVLDGGRYSMVHVHKSVYKLFPRNTGFTCVSNDIVYPLFPQIYQVNMELKQIPCVVRVGSE